MYKFQNYLSAPLIDDTFQVPKNTFNLRLFQKIANNRKNLVNMGLEVMSYRATQLRNLVPVEIKQSPSLSILIEKIKTLQCDN